MNDDQPSIKSVVMPKVQEIPRYSVDNFSKYEPELVPSNHGKLMKAQEVIDFYGKLPAGLPCFLRRRPPPSGGG